MCSHACIIYIVWGWRTKLTYDLIFYNQYMHTFLLVSASMIFVLEVCLWILPSPSVISASTVKCTHTCMACHQFIFPMLAPLLFHNQTSKILVIWNQTPVCIYTWSKQTRLDRPEPRDIPSSFDGLRSVLTKALVWTPRPNSLKEFYRQRPRYNVRRILERQIHIHARKQSRQMWFEWPVTEVMKMFVYQAARVSDQITVVEFLYQIPASKVSLKWK